MNISQDNLNQLTKGLNPIDIRLELFKKKDFRFIYTNTAKNDEGDWVIGTQAVHEKQKRALEILTDNEYDEFLYGGAAGGAKSWTGVCWIVFSCLAYPDTNWFIARNQLKDLLDSVLKTFRLVCKEYGVVGWNFNAQKNYIKFENGSVINLIEVSYKPSDPLYEDLGSTEYTGGWIEEVGEVHEMAAIVLGTRIGRYNNSKYGIKKKLFMTCNPKQNWAKTKFYDKHKNGKLYEENKELLKNGKKRAQRIYLNCLVTENPFIDQDYIDGLYAKSVENTSIYERLFKGNWDYEDNPYQLAEQQMIDIIFDNDHVQEGKTYLTCDVARQGSDKAVIIAWRGWIVEEIITYDKSSIPDIVHAIKYLRNKYKIPRTRCIADGDGVGGGVIDYANIKEFNNNARPIRSGKDTPNYRNLQIQCLYLFAEQINEGAVWIRADLENKVREDIKVELAQIQSVPNKRDGNKLDCKTKGEIKSDIGRSPDYRDALFMRVFFELKRGTANLTTEWS